MFFPWTPVWGDRKSVTERPDGRQTKLFECAQSILVRRCPNRNTHEDLLDEIICKFCKINSNHLRLIPDTCYCSKVSTIDLWVLSLTILIHSFIPLACTEFDDSLPFSGASSIPLCYVLFPATLPHQPFFHPLSPHLAIYFLVYLSILFFTNSYIISFWEFYFLPFSVHPQTNVIYLTLLSLL